jgi:hypothetical protein
MGSSTKGKRSVLAGEACFIGACNGVDIRKVPAVSKRVRNQ